MNNMIQVYDEVFRKTYNQAWHKIGNQVNEQVSNKVWDQVKDQIQVKLMWHVDNIIHPIVVIMLDEYYEQE